MSDKTGLRSQSAVYPGYPLNRVPYAGSAYQQFQSQGMNITGAGPLGNMHNLKATLPTSAQSTAELTNASRQGYSSPLMVLPSGQTVPLAAFYGHQNNNAAEPANHVPYLPNGMYPNLVGNTAMNNYAWPYGLTPDIHGVDTNRRPSWSSNEEAMPSSATLSGAGQQEYYQGYSYMSVTPAVSQHYIAGPIQPMKCSDNKSYEMVNLDELTQHDPPIPRAVPALWTNQEELSLAKCLQNPEGITNVYIRGFMPDTTDQDLEHWASRFGDIESCKAIIEQDTGKCKGFGFVMYYSPAAAENCIRGFFHLGFQASYAQKSRNSRLKDLEDRLSTNIYCTGVPIDWNESDLAKHFLPYHAVSTKICRDVPSGVSKEVGFARFETREVAEQAIKDFHSYLNEDNGVKLFLRFADTKAQKQLKHQSQERRNWRSREYSYSVEHTPSPTLTRFQEVATHISPNGSYISPAGASNNFTPATSVSPADIAGVNKVIPMSRSNAWPMSGGLQSITNSAGQRPHLTTMMPVALPYNNVVQKGTSGIPVISEQSELITKTPSPKKVTIKIEPASGKENVTTSAQANS